jgi:hypothetical protein
MSNKPHRHTNKKQNKNEKNPTTTNNMREITIKGKQYEDRILQTILNFNILDKNGSML